jgi:hypothetical protein
MVLGVIVTGVGAWITVAKYSHDRTATTPSFSIAESFPSLDIIDTVSKLDTDFSKKLSVRVEGSEVKSLQIAVYAMKNDGPTPILPDHFIQPITVAVEAPWRIISATNAPAPFSKFSLEWTQISNQKWTAKPALFNPGDCSYAVVYATKDGKGSIMNAGGGSSVFSCSARIVNVPTIEAKEKPEAKKEPHFFWTYVELDEYEVYLFALFDVALFSVFLYLANGTSFKPRLTTRSSTLLISALILSMTTAEIVVSLFTRPLKTQWIGSWVLLAVHGVFLIYFLVASVSLKYMLSSREQNGD